MKTVNKKIIMKGLLFANLLLVGCDTATNVSVAKVSGTDTGASSLAMQSSSGGVGISSMGLSSVALSYSSMLAISSMILAQSSSNGTAVSSSVVASSSLKPSSSSAIVLASSTSQSSAANSFNANVAPGGNFDLSIWELQEPVGTTGSPNMVQPAKLVGASGYSDAYFYTGTDGSMTFYCPVKGVVTTGNSSYARSELREMNADGTVANWAIAGSHSLSATLKVVSVPDHVCIGQIHLGTALPGNSGTSTLPICELFYASNGDIKLGIESSATGSEGSYAKMPVITNVPVGQEFSYTIQLVANGTLTVTILDGKSNPVTVKTIDASFFTYGVYFKAGDYDQTTPNNATYINDAATVSFYALHVSHQ